MKTSNIKTHAIKFILSALFAATAISCSSVPKEIPAELTAQELIQKGQDSFENGNYKAALCYYNAVTERYSDALPVYVEACYEIGHIYMKEKDYPKATAVFEQITEIYSHTAPGEIPGAFEKLSKLELAKIPAKKQ